VNRVDELFDCMGCAARVRLESVEIEQAQLERAAIYTRALLEHADRTLSRFDPTSALSELNRDPRAAIPAGRLLRDFVMAARHAGERSGGLVDATVLGEVERAGYATSRTGASPAPLDEALTAAPARRPAAPSAARTYARVTIGEGGKVVRPPGARLDSGGIAKGLAVDLAANHLPAGVRYAIALGGDLAVGGSPVWEIAVQSAHDGSELTRLHVRAGGVATSGISGRIWQNADGTFAHHLIDPATGRPAWTGLVAVTAVERSALDAEVAAKTALLAGPRHARRLLRRYGGVLQHDDGTVDVVPAAPVVKLPAVAA
jgi:thiamine biosynthesis lipoprotein